MHMGGTNRGTDYNLLGEVIPHNTTEKDLGAIITEDGKTGRQCAAVANKAMTKNYRAHLQALWHFDMICVTMLYRAYIQNTHPPPHTLHPPHTHTLTHTPHTHTQNKTKLKPSNKCATISDRITVYQWRLSSKNKEKWPTFRVDKQLFLKENIKICLIR